jgi:hypothetical protein
MLGTPYPVAETGQEEEAQVGQRTQEEPVERSRRCCRTRDLRRRRRYRDCILCGLYGLFGASAETRLPGGQPGKRA